MTEINDILFPILFVYNTLLYTKLKDHVIEVAPSREIPAERHASVLFLF
jgi:hypothetical protein